MKARAPFRGTGTAVVTPFTKNNEVDFEALKKHINRLITKGVDYLVVLGTTAEAVTLSGEEKQQVVDLFISEASGKVPIAVGIGGNNTQAVIDQIEETDFKGIDGILSVAPYYNKPSQKGLYEHFTAISKASPVPVIVYNVPGRTGVNIKAETTLQLAHDHSNIAAVKEASGDFSQGMYLAKDKPEGFLVLSGEDAITFPLIATGFDGVISVVANAIPAEFSQMIQHALDGKVKEARELHHKILPFTDMLFAEGNPAGVKAALHSLGIMENRLRLPLVPVSTELKLKIDDYLHLHFR